MKVIHTQIEIGAPAQREWFVERPIAFSDFRLAA
jgi:hypothetical protein